MHQNNHCDLNNDYVVSLCTANFQPPYANNELLQELDNYFVDICDEDEDCKVDNENVTNIKMSKRLLDYLPRFHDKSFWEFCCFVDQKNEKIQLYEILAWKLLSFPKISDCGRF